MTEPIIAVSSEIGRGHPQYLDSALLALSRLGAECVPLLRLPEIVTGLSRVSWGIVCAAYRMGAQDGAATWLYNRLRPPNSKPSNLQLSLLGSNLRRRFAGYKGLCLVDHPLLAHILAPTCRVAYIHGEIAAPALCAVPCARRTFVPLQSTAARLEELSIKREALCVTGLVIEPQLADIAEPSFAARVERLSQSDAPITVGFFTSGAQPRPHNERILLAAASTVRTGHRVIIFWGPSWLRAARGEAALRHLAASPDRLRSLWTRDRAAELSRTVEMFPSLDVMVAASHERTNWAVGLGLPMFALLPHLGPFAQANYDFARAQGVCLPLTASSDAASLGEALTAMRRDGRLARMARNGWERHAINGAETIGRNIPQTD